MYRMIVYPRRLHSTKNAPVKEAHLNGVVEWGGIEEKSTPPFQESIQKGFMQPPRMRVMAIGAL